MDVATDYLADEETETISVAQLIADLERIPGKDSDIYAVLPDGSQRIIQTVDILRDGSVGVILGVVPYVDDPPSVDPLDLADHTGWTPRMRQAVARPRHPEHDPEDGHDHDPRPPDQLDETARAGTD